MPKKYVFRLFAFCVVVCTTSCPSQKKEGKLQNLSFLSNGINREYLLYTPGHLKKDAPLLFAMHGYTGNAKEFMLDKGFNELADENGFAVCYPQGLTDSAGKTFWQVGYSFHKNLKVDDVEFLSKLALYLHKAYSLNPEKTYATGESNGADMCIVLACKKPGVFKAVAPVLGCMMKAGFDSCNSKIPIPVFMVNGTADDITYWDGDMQDKQGYGPYLPTLDCFNFFVKRNQCKTYQTDTLPDLNKSDGSIIITEKYSDGINGNKVWLYEVVNAKHQWPGCSGNMDIKVSDEICRFFSLK
ncbi:MAG: PHB depolymerase family esterase [Bacteroidales bacterium]